MKLKSWLRAPLRPCKNHLTERKLGKARRNSGTLIVLALAASLLVPAAGVRGGPFPAGPAIDPSFPTASPFLVIINGVTYSTMLNDPAMVVTRSAVTTEGSEGAEAVSNTGYAACSATVSDADIGCFPPDLGTEAARRELHAEMLSLNMSGTAVGRNVRYLAGQPAYDALNALGQAALYQNSCGEVVSLDPTGDPNNDFPARSFWAVRGVVKITPAPINTSGVFFAKSLILMDLGTVNKLPPVGSTYANYVNGTTNEDGTGLPCGALPTELFDATNSIGPSVGYIEGSVTHVLLVRTPTVTKWGLIVLAVLLLSVGAVYLRRRQRMTNGTANG